METKEQISARNKAFYNANREKILAHKARNSDRINATRRARTGALPLAEYLASVRISPEHKKGKRACYSAVRYGIRSNYKWITLLGCSSQDFKNHLQKNFKPGWSWENYGTTWECDHIVPLSSFDLSDKTQLAKAGHFTNVQPITPTGNIKKSINHRKASLDAD